MITISQETCIGCGQCVAVCPFTVLEMVEGKASCTPKPCISCMHCAIICPVHAITYDQKEVVGEMVQPLPQHIADDVELLIKQRRSYRKFQKKKVPQEEVRSMIEAACYVASAKNTHPTHWLIIDDDRLRDRLMQIIETTCRDNKISPEIIAELENHNNPVIGENASLLIGYCSNDALDPIHDTAIAMTSIELMMQARGIGTCWGGYLLRYLNNIPACKELLGLSEHHSVCGTILFGYPNQAPYKYLPKRQCEGIIRFN